MSSHKILAILAGLASAPSLLACDKSSTESTEVPQASSEPSSDTAGAEGEHACGNHAEGQCGGQGEDAGAGAGPQAAVASERSFDVKAGEFAEANFKMKAGSTVTVTFSGASEELAWNIHSHDHEGGTKIHDEGQASEDSVEFRAPEDGIFSILWKNEGAAASPLEVSLSLAEGAEIHSWMPEE